MIIDLSLNNHTFVIRGDNSGTGYPDGPIEILSGPMGGPSHWYSDQHSFDVVGFTKLPQFTVSFWMSIMDPPQGGLYGTAQGFNWIRAGVVLYNNSNYPITGGNIDHDDGWGVYISGDQSNQSMRGMISQQTPSVQQHEIEILDFDAQTPSDAWHYITLTYDGTNLVSYRNGIQTNTSTLPNPISNSNSVHPTGNLSIGNYGTLDYAGFVGHISEVLILNVPLGANSVYQLATEQVTQVKLLKDIGVSNLPFTMSDVELWTKTVTPDWAQLDNEACELLFELDIADFAQTDYLSSELLFELDITDFAQTDYLSSEMLFELDITDFAQTDYLSSEMLFELEPADYAINDVVTSDVLFEVANCTITNEYIPLLDSEYAIQTYHMYKNLLIGCEIPFQKPFIIASKISTTIKKEEGLYAREDKEIREIKAGIKLKKRHPEIYKMKHRLVEETIDSKHTLEKLTESYRKKDVKIIYYDIKDTLSGTYSEDVLNQIATKLESLEYISDSLKEEIKLNLKSAPIDVSSDVGTQVETRVNSVRSE